jgi:alcohol dehydrogenase class IV
MSMNYFMPTKIVMGEDCVFQNRLLLKELGTRALVVTGKHSAKANGALDDVRRALEANDQSFYVFDQVMSNPTVDCVFDGAGAAKKEGCDFVIAIGGGSPMDAAKTVAALAVMDITRSQIFSASYPRALPLAAIPTTAGTGSEVTPYAILTNDEAKTKTNLSSPALFARLALLDAKYLAGLSRAVTVNTAVDALSHAVEGMLSVRASPLSDTLARESIRSIAECFPALQSDSLSPAHREKLLLASTLAGMVIANTGTTVVHVMGYQLTYWQHIDHGRANGLLLGEFLECYAEKERSHPAHRVAEILAILGMESPRALSQILDGLFGSREKISRAELESYAERAMTGKNIANSYIPPDYQDLMRIYLASLS